MLNRFRSWAKSAFHRSRMEEAMAQEMENHIERRVQDLVSRGIPRAEAERRSRIEFGGRETYKEECRQALGLSLLDELARNVRFALRQLRKTPAFTITAVLTLALCIGANAVIFSLVDTALIRPLPYPEPERLAQVVVHVREARGEWLRSGQNGAAFELVRDNASVIKVAAQAGFAGVNLVANNHVEYVRQQRVSAGYFSVLGVAPLYGREFTADEDRPGGAAVVVLSHALWRRIFQSDPSVLNQAVTLRGESHTVVGIMPADFRSPATADVWTPLRPSRTGEGGGTNYTVIARLNDGISWAQAQASLEPLSRDAATAHQMSPNVTARLGLLPLQEMFTRRARNSVRVMGRGGHGAAHRLPQYCRPAAGAGVEATPRGSYTHGAGRQPRSLGSPAPDGKCCARSYGWRPRPVAGLCRHQRAESSSRRRPRHF